MEGDKKVCFICWDEIPSMGGVRSKATLRCGHEYHLDCIGSAFNFAKGCMRCPYCRDHETEGTWTLSPTAQPAAAASSSSSSPCYGLLFCLLFLVFMCSCTTKAGT